MCFSSCYFPLQSRAFSKQAPPKQQAPAKSNEVAPEQVRETSEPVASKAIVTPEKACAGPEDECGQTKKCAPRREDEAAETKSSGERGAASPALPKSWQLASYIHKHDASTELTKDVDLEVFGGVSPGDGDEEVRLPENDDEQLTLAAGGVTFAEAWKSFKQQEEVGFGKLRDYVSDNYIALLRKMLSPPRERVRTTDLGPSVFKFRDRQIRRDDFVVVNERNIDLRCSVWLDSDFDEKVVAKRTGLLRRPVKAKRYCVVYAHDVGGSRLASLSSLGVALDAGVAGYCAFDCSGCGRSGGLHVSFGFYESYDIACVVSELIKKRGFTDVVVWGRGAGAVAALKYAQSTGIPAPAQLRQQHSILDWSSSVFAPSSPKSPSSPTASSSYPKRLTVRVDMLASAAACSAEEKQPPKRQRTSLESVNDDDVSLRETSTNATLIVTERDRLDAARRFASGMQIEPLTWQWVVSKPPLVVTAVESGSDAEAAGVRVGDEIAFMGSSMRLPHTVEEFHELLDSFARRDRIDLPLGLTRAGTLSKAEVARFEPVTRPAGLVLDCVIDSPAALVETLKDQAAEREPMLVGLLEPLLSSALDLLFHSVQKRANFEPSLISSTKFASSVHDVPALFGVNEFHDADRGIPSLAEQSRIVYSAYPGKQKKLVKYNAPLRLALRGSLDAMSSGFLNKSFVFLQSLPNFHEQTGITRIIEEENGGTDEEQQGEDDDDDEKVLLSCDDEAEEEEQQKSPPTLPRWVVTTRPWSHAVTEQIIDDYE